MNTLAFSFSPARPYLQPANLCRWLNWGIWDFCSTVMAEQVVLMSVWLKREKTSPFRDTIGANKLKKSVLFRLIHKLPNLCPGFCLHNAISTQDFFVLILLFCSCLKLKQLSLHLEIGCPGFKKALCELSSDSSYLSKLIILPRRFKRFIYFESRFRCLACLFESNKSSPNHRQISHRNNLALNRLIGIQRFNRVYFNAC